MLTYVDYAAVRDSVHNGIKRNRGGCKPWSIIENGGCHGSISIATHRAVVCIRILIIGGWIPNSREFMIYRIVSIFCKVVVVGEYRGICWITRTHKIPVQGALRSRIGRKKCVLGITQGGREPEFFERKIKERSSDNNKDASKERRIVQGETTRHLV